MNSTPTKKHDWICRDNVRSNIAENLADDKGVDAGAAIYDEECFAWGIRVGDLIDEYLIDGTSTCSCLDREVVA